MNTNYSSNRSFKYKLIALVFGLNLYHEVKWFGFTDKAFISAAGIIYLVCWYFIELFYAKKKRDTPHAITLISLFIFISAVIVTLIL